MLTILFIACCAGAARHFWKLRRSKHHEPRLHELEEKAELRAELRRENSELRFRDDAYKRPVPTSMPGDPEKRSG